MLIHCIVLEVVFAKTAQVLEFYYFFVNRKNKIEMILSFYISFSAFKIFYIQCIFLFKPSVLLLWGWATSLPDACILERNGKLIFVIFELHLIGCYLLAERKPELKGSSLQSVAHFPTFVNPSLCPLPINRDGRI